MKFKEIVSKFKEECDKFNQRGGGYMSSVFKNMSMQEIKRMQSSILEHPKLNESIPILLKLLKSQNNVLRERTCIILGEMYKKELLEEKSKEKVNKSLLELSLDQTLSQPINTVLRECVTAMGKSNEETFELILSELLKDRKIKGIRTSVLVSLGKIGNSKTPKKVLVFLNKSKNLKLSDVMYSVWAFGKLAGYSRSNREIIHRANFKNALNFLYALLDNKNINHPTLHLYGLFAIGEICDQREKNKYPDSISGSILNFTLKYLRRKEIWYRENHISYGDKVIQTCEGIIKMLRGEELSEVQEKILLNIRNLLVPNEKIISSKNDNFEINLSEVKPITEKDLVIKENHLKLNRDESQMEELPKISQEFKKKTIKPKSIEDLLFGNSKDKH